MYNKNIFTILIKSIALISVLSIILIAIACANQAEEPVSIIEKITAVKRYASENDTSHFNVRIISETLVDTGFGMYDDFGGCILVFELENISGRAITVDIAAVFVMEHGQAASLIDQYVHFEPGQARQFTHSFGEYVYSDSLHLIIEYWFSLL